MPPAANQNDPCRPHTVYAAASTTLQAPNSWKALGVLRRVPRLAKEKPKREFQRLLSGNPGLCCFPGKFPNAQTRLSKCI